MSEGRKSAGAATLEQYTIAQIPASERHGRPRDLFTIWFSSNIMPLTFVTGALAVGQTFRYRWLPAARTRAVVSVAIVAVALIGALAFQSTFLTSYVNFILFLLYVLIPWTAINLVDFYLIRHGNYDVASFFDPAGGIYGRVNWSTLVIYLVGVAVQIPFVNTTLYEGPVAKSLNGADISWIVGLAVVIPLYYFVARARVSHELPATVAAGAPSA